MPKRFHKQWLVLVFALAAACTSAFAQRPDDAKRERGKKMLAKMPALKPGEKINSYFEQLMGPTETIGYLVASITAESGKLGEYSKEGVIYKYEMETSIRFDNNARIQATIRGSLRPNFEPIELELRRVFIEPEGKERISVNRIQISDAKVTLISGEGDKAKTQEVARPASPFVFAMETLMQRLDLSGLEDFVLAELDPQTGKAGELTYVVQPTAQGGMTASAFLADDQPSYQFWFDGRGKLERWGEASVPAISRPTIPQRIEQIKAELKAAAEEWERKEKAMRPKGPGK